MYCVGCEEAKTEDDVLTENGEKVYLFHLRPVERVEEKNYFFRFSKYHNRSSSTGTEARRRRSSPSRA